MGTSYMRSKHIPRYIKPAKGVLNLVLWLIKMYHTESERFLRLHRKRVCWSTVTLPLTPFSL